MNLQLAQIDLGDFGSLHTYDMSGREGVLLHEFAPLHDNVDRVAIFIAEGFHLGEALTLEQGGERVGLNFDRYQSRTYAAEDRVFSLVSAPLSASGMVARVAFAGGAPVGLHVLVVDKSVRTLRKLIQDAKGKILEPVFAKFKDKCWLCMRLVRALCSALIGGVDIDADDIAEALRKIFPEEWIPDLPDTDLGDLLKRILDLLRKYDPRNVIARKLCEELGYCLAPGGQAASPPIDSASAALLAQLRYLLSQGVSDPDVDLFVAVLTGNEAGVKKALDQGANVNVTDTQLVQRHRETLRGMPPPGRP
ncbi:hypothetical protein [Hydrogenophaga sp.]|uniref:hypothetical protein n=1 Tax=Hydrogenophaga sp. TaxID=1904254 RepID=UPI003F71FC78